MKTFTRNEVYEVLLDKYKQVFNSFSMSEKIREIELFMDTICKDAGISNNKWLKGEVPEDIIRKHSKIISCYVESNFLESLEIYDPNLETTRYSLYFNDEDYDYIVRGAADNKIIVNTYLNDILNFGLTYFTPNKEYHKREHRFRELKIDINQYQIDKVKSFMKEANKPEENYYVTYIEQMIRLLIEHSIDYFGFGVNFHDDSWNEF